MKLQNLFLSSIIALLFLVISCKKGDTAYLKKANESKLSSKMKLDPFAENNGQIPPDSIFQGPIFKANYNYPKEVPQRSYPWEEVLNGKALTKDNAKAYVLAIKNYVADDLSIMIDQPKKWIDSPNKLNWFNMAWSAQDYNTAGWGIGWEGLETVYGTMTGQVIKNGIFKDYGFEGPMQNHALVYYNDVAAVTLNKLWKSNGGSGFLPEYNTNAAQFAPNSIIIKAAGTTVTEDEWQVLKGSGTFHIFREMAYGKDQKKGNMLQKLTWIQFDIIIKDPIASPETGWVFSTFVYDTIKKSSSTYDRLTLLGVSWGNDPGKMKGDETLEETYINSEAPPYTKATIGYGKRLSGPIDVAVVGGLGVCGVRDAITVDSVFVLNPKNDPIGGKGYLHFTASACFSCHGTASFPAQNDFYPSPDPDNILVWTDTLYNPASPDWSNWYQNRNGNEIMPNTKGVKKSIMALDYDLFMSFALNNSLLGLKHFPDSIKIPKDYKLIDSIHRVPNYMPRSK